MVKLLFVELNEINFDVLKKYIESGYKFSHLSKLLTFKNINTLCEEKYEHLEPWIQWHSIHTGKSFEEHKIFRLGDGRKSNFESLHKKLENLGYKVGAISPMNLKNDLKNPSYFIPDPWTNTVTDGSWWSKNIHKMINQTVTDNAAKKISLGNLFILILTILRFSRFRNLVYFFNLALSSIKKPWKRALFFDLLLHEINIFNLKKSNCDYASIFFNAGAHLQHYYFFNSKILNKEKNPDWYVKEDDDPILEMLKVYNKIIKDYLNLKSPMIVATGLSQIAYDRKKFYYRLSNHKKFLNLLSIKSSDVKPRMSRDFSVFFENNQDRDMAKVSLSQLKEELTNIPLFGDFELKEKELFVSLTFPEMINEKHYFLSKGKKINLEENTVFVCIKNGMHHSKGHVFFSENFEGNIIKNNSHVKNLHESVLSHFNIHTSADA